MNKKIIASLLVLTGMIGVAGYNEVKKEQVAREKPVVGILQFMKHPALDEIHCGIENELAKEGFEKGKNIEIDYQNAQGDQSNLKTMATRFSNEDADVSVGIATPAAVALANTISDKTVVFSGITDPVGSKLIKNEAKPEKNITGISGKAPLKDQLKLIQDFMPQLKTLGVVYTSSDDSASTEAKQMIELAEAAGIKVKAYTITSSNDLHQTSQQMVANGQVDAVFVPTDNTIAGAMPTLIKNTNDAKVPVFPTVDTMVEAGGVAASSINQRELGTMTGKMIAKNLRGEKVEDLPVGAIEKGTPIINQKQADDLGIKIPDAYKDAKRVDKE